MIKNIDIKLVSEKNINEIKAAVNRVVESGWYLKGKENKSFERNYAAYIGTDYCIGVANGLDALRLILRAYIETGRIKPRDEIIVPANTYIATILAISQNNLIPVLVEPDINTYQINPSLIEQHISQKTRGIMLVHLYGQCAFTDYIATLCKKYNLLLFEDNAQAHGCEYRGKKTGSLGHAAAHSFYPTKNLGAFGDAGAVTTNDPQISSIIRTLANYGSSRKYVFDYIGLNSRLDEIHAAILDVKLKFLDADNEQRRKIARFYIENINHPDVIVPIVRDWRSHVFHIFTIRSHRRKKLHEYLTQNGIQTEIHYPIPPHKQKCYPQWNGLSFPISEQIHDEELSLPISPVLTEKEVLEVVHVINSFI